MAACWAGERRSLAFQTKSKARHHLELKNNPAKTKRGGPRPGAGRPKGSPNKTTTAVKEMILAALDEVGGIEYLVTQASANPTAFLTLVGKVLPLQVAHEGNIGQAVTVTFRRADD